MKYIITEQQYNTINEELGVPENIYEAAIEFYDLFLEDIKTIRDKRNEYKFYGDVDITLGSHKKIKITEYSLTIKIHEPDDYEESPQIATMGMGQTFIFDRDIMMKRTNESTIAEFSIDYAVAPDWEPHQLAEEFDKNRINHISDLAHEIKHKYDKQAKPVGLIGDDAEYAAVQNMPSFGINALDNKFKQFLYFTSAAESLVRPSELSTEMKLTNITREDFREFLESNTTFKKLVEIKNFTYEKFIEEMRNSMDKIDELLEILDIDSEGMSDDEKINKVLKAFYYLLANTKMETFNEYVAGPVGGLMELLSFFGEKPNKNDAKLEKIKTQFYNYISKYKNNPNQFYIDEIKKFHYVSNQMIKKLSKLYAMAANHSQKTESIINWELHMKLMEKKNTPLKYDTEIRKI